MVRLRAEIYKLCTTHTQSIDNIIIIIIHLFAINKQTEFNTE